MGGFQARRGREGGGKEAGTRYLRWKVKDRSCDRSFIYTSLGLKYFAKDLVHHGLGLKWLHV